MFDGDQQHIHLAECDSDLFHGRSPLILIDANTTAT
jgi:hypothetical protein